MPHDAASVADADALQIDVDRDAVCLTGNLMHYFACDRAVLAALRDDRLDGATAKAVTP